MSPSSPPLFMRCGDLGCASISKLTDIVALFFTLSTNLALRTNCSPCAESARATPIANVTIFCIRISMLLCGLFGRRLCVFFFSPLRLAACIADVNELVESIEPERRTQSDGYNRQEPAQQAVKPEVFVLSFIPRPAQH